MDTVERFFNAISDPWQAVVVCVIVIAAAAAYIVYVKEVTKW